MHITVRREELLKPLGIVAGVVERRQTLPILSNILLRHNGKELSLTGTDLEVEIKARIPAQGGTAGEMTVRWEEDEEDQEIGSPISGQSQTCYKQQQGKQALG